MTRRLNVRSVIGLQNGRDAARAASSLGKTLSSIIDQFEDFSSEATLAAMRPTFEKSQEYCPKLTGAMVASGYLEEVGFRGSPRVEIGYGKHGVPHYTAVQHEDMTFKHKAPTRAKWLEAAVMEDLGLIFERLGKEYSSFMNGGGNGI